MATNVLTKFSFVSKANIIPSSAAGLDPSQPLTIDTGVTGDDRDDGYESPDVVNSDVSSSLSTNSTSSGSGDNGDTVGGVQGEMSADLSQSINPENTETSLRFEDRPRMLLDSLDFHNSRIHSPPLARRDHVTAADDADSSDVLATTAKSSSGRQPRFVSLTDVDDEDTKLSDELATVVNLDAVTLDALLTRGSYNSSTVTPTHRPRKETSLDDLIPLESSSDLVGFGALGGVTDRAIGQTDVTDSADYSPPIVISSDPPANLRPALKARDGSKPMSGKKAGLSFDQRVQVVYRDVLDEHIRQKYAGNSTNSQQEGQGRELSDDAPAEPSNDVTGQNDDVIQPVVDNNIEPAVNQPSIITTSASSQQSFSIPRVSSLRKVGDSSTPVDASLSAPSPRSNNERSVTAADNATPSDSDRLQQVDNNRSQVKRSSLKLQRTTAERNDARGDVSITAAAGAGTVSSRDNQQTKSSIAVHLRDRSIQQNENSFVPSSSADKPELNDTNSGFYQISAFNGSNFSRQRFTNTSTKPTISNDDSELTGRPSPSVSISHAKSASLPPNLTPSQMYDTTRSASLPPNTLLSNYNTDAVIPHQSLSRPQPSVTADNFKQIRPGGSADELLSERGMPASLNRPSGQGQGDSNSRVPTRSSANGQSSLTLSQPITTDSQPLSTSTVQMRKRSSGVPVNNNTNRPNDTRPSSVQYNYLPAYGVDNRAEGDEDDYIRSHQTTDVMARLGAIKRDDQWRASASTGSGSQRVQELRVPVKAVDRPNSFHTTLSLTDSQPTNQQRDNSDVSNVQHQRRGSDDVKRRPLSQQVDHPPPQMRAVNGVTAVPRPPRAVSMSLSQPQQVRLSRMPEDILRGVAPYSVSTTYTPAFIPASSFPSPTKSNADTTAEMRMMTASATSLTLPVGGGGGAIVRGQRSRESGKRASFASTADILKMMKMQHDPTYRQNTPAASSPNSKQ